MNTSEIKIKKYSNGSLKSAADVIVREEPLEIYINGEKKYFCMRMPGMDYELSLGLLYSEGLIDSESEVEESRQHSGRVDFTIKGKIDSGVKKVYSSSGSMFSDELIAPPVRNDGEFSADKLFILQNDFFKLQDVFQKTGGTHAAAFYSSDGGLISFAEDVGRHNALDKCMGSALVSGKALSVSLIMLSSRISFEMLRKSVRTGASMVAGVSAPTSAAVDAGNESGITLVGFLRDGRCNVYTHPERIRNA